MSRPAAGLTLAEADAIVGSAQRYNAPRGITGRLLIVTDAAERVLAFMQWIEGPPLAIRTCLRRILSDSRHHSIRVVQDGAAQERSYPEWSMRQEVISVDEVEAALAAAGVSGRVDADGALEVEGEIIPSEDSGTPPQT